jgi:uncharacterized protein YjbJ (UPF0337 family)
MRNKSDTPTRGEVNERVEKNKEQMNEKIDDLDLIATDAETVRDTLESLDLSGTSEGSDSVEGAIEEAENVTVEKFDEEDEALQEVQSDMKDFEGDLQERTDSSESDSEKVSEAIGQVTTAETKGELDQAKSEIGDDIEFLKEQNETAREAREENEQLQQEHRSRVQGGKG